VTKPFVERFFKVAGVKVPQQYLNESERGSISLQQHYLTFFMDSGGRGAINHPTDGVHVEPIDKFLTVDLAKKAAMNFLRNMVLEDGEEVEVPKIEWIQKDTNVFVGVVDGSDGEQFFIIDEIQTTKNRMEYFW